MEAGLAGGLSALLSRFLVPLPPGYAEAGPSFEELNARLGSRASRAELSGLLLSIPLILLWCGFIRGIRHLTTHRFSDADLILRPEVSAWLLPMLFGGLLLLLLGVWITPRHIFGTEEYADYIRLCRLKHGYCSDRIANSLLLIFPIPVLLLLVSVADNYTVFRKDAVILNPYLSFGTTTHSYSNVSRITTAPKLIAPNGKTVHRRVYVIHFQNGDRWNSDSGPGIGDGDDWTKSRIARLVSERSGTPIWEQPIFQRGEL